MIATRWSHQDDYAGIIESIAAANGVPASLAYGLIGQESSFNPTAIRNEPNYYCAATGQTGDASYGLTQVLYCTALGLGFTGDVSGLFDPTINLSLGLQLLGNLLSAHGGDVAAALSAYNGGDRPALGYGTRRADGTFANQAYVTRVMRNADYFGTYLAARDGTPPASGATATLDTGAPDGSGSTTGLIVAGLGIAAAAYFLIRALR